MTDAEAEAPPMTPEQSAIMAHDEAIFQIQKQIETLNDAVKTLCRDVETLMKDRT